MGRRVVVDGVVDEDPGGEREVLCDVDREVIDVRSARGLAGIGNAPVR